MSEYLPADEYRKKAWKAIYKFINFVKPLLIRYDVHQVKAVLLGSVFRGQARCPREYSVYVFKTNATLSFERYRNDSEAFYFDFSVFTKDGRKFSRKLKIGESFFELLFPNRIFLFVVKEMVKALKRKLEEKQAEIEDGRRTSVDE